MKWRFCSFLLKSNQQPCRQALTWNQHSNLFWPEIEVFGLTRCVKWRICSFLSQINSLAVRPLIRSVWWCLDGGHLQGCDGYLLPCTRIVVRLHQPLRHQLRSSSIVNEFNYRIFALIAQTLSGICLNCRKDKHLWTDINVLSLFWL